MSLNRNQGMWAGLCTPAKLYGIVSLFSIAGLLYKQHLVGAISQGLFSAIWLFLLNWICGQGWTGLSWFLVLLPIILGILLIVSGVFVAVAKAGMPYHMQRAQHSQYGQHE
jgi:hypothetical protein